MTNKNETWPIGGARNPRGQVVTPIESRETPAVVEARDTAKDRIAKATLATDTRDLAIAMDLEVK